MKTKGAKDLRPRKRGEPYRNKNSRSMKEALAASVGEAGEVVVPRKPGPRPMSKNPNDTFAPPPGTCSDPVTCVKYRRRTWSLACDNCKRGIDRERENADARRIGMRTDELPGKCACGDDMSTKAERVRGWCWKCMVDPVRKRKAEYPTIVEVSKNDQEQERELREGRGEQAGENIKVEVSV